MCVCVCVRVRVCVCVCASACMCMCVSVWSEITKLSIYVLHYTTAHTYPRIILVFCHDIHKCPNSFPIKYVIVCYLYVISYYVCVLVCVYHCVCIVSLCVLMHVCM